VRTIERMTRNSNGACGTWGEFVRPAGMDSVWNWRSDDRQDRSRICTVLEYNTQVLVLITGSVCLFLLMTISNSPRSKNVQHCTAGTINIVFGVFIPLQELSILDLLTLR
jgi:hypothetical protein